MTDIMSPPCTQTPPGTVWIPGGRFRMGSADFYVEERPVREVTVSGFWMDRHEVTNEYFARFVAGTGYVTVAERPPAIEDFPGAPPENLVPGSMVFRKRTAPVNLRNYANWCWTAQSSPGATRSFRTEKLWRTHGRASSPGKICLPMDTKGLRPSDLFRRTATASMIWRVTCGNGQVTGMSRAPVILLSNRAA
jgi:formylglycine-generating enzyme required for sulfatase activity